MEIFRRVFAVSTVAGAAIAQEGGALTAGQVIERIQKNVGVPWRPQTVDTIKSGSPTTQVKGIAATMMATLDVVQRAAAAGEKKKELIVLGHISSEQAGMLNCANWLKTLITEVPIEFVPAAKPIWRVAL